MIITRTPFRISFAGGGSDLAAFHGEEPGAVLTTAIDKYMFLAVKSHFGEVFRVSYSRTELVTKIEEIQHPIVREALQLLGIRRGLEIVSLADLPAQSGMGSSSSFTVGLLHALHAFLGRTVSPETLARQACHIEIERLAEPIGKQDQYIAAYGGFQFIQFLPGGDVLVDPVVCPRATREELNRRLMLFFTGLTRQAREVLHRQSGNTPNRRVELRRLCEIAAELRDILTTGSDLNRFGHLLGEAWEVKKQLDESISNSQVDELYRLGREAGALGGKLLGAGSGGFLLFYVEPHRQAAVREALAGLVEVPFEFEPQGSKIIYLD